MLKRELRRWACAGVLSAGAWMLPLTAHAEPDTSAPDDTQTTTTSADDPSMKGTGGSGMAEDDSPSPDEADSSADVIRDRSVTKDVNGTGGAGNLDNSAEPP